MKWNKIIIKLCLKKKIAEDGKQKTQRQEYGVETSIYVYMHLKQKPNKMLNMQNGLEIRAFIYDIIDNLKN